MPFQLKEVNPLHQKFKQFEKELIRQSQKATEEAGPLLTQPAEQISTLSNHEKHVVLVKSKKGDQHVTKYTYKGKIDSLHFERSLGPGSPATDKRKYGNLVLNSQDTLSDENQTNSMSNSEYNLAWILNFKSPLNAVEKYMASKDKQHPSQEVLKKGPPGSIVGKVQDKTAASRQVAALKHDTMAAASRSLNFYKNRIQTSQHRSPEQPHVPVRVSQEVNHRTLKSQEGQRTKVGTAIALKTQHRLLSPQNKKNRLEELTSSVGPLSANIQVLTKP